MTILNKYRNGNKNRLVAMPYMKYWVGHGFKLVAQMEVVKTRCLFF